MRCGPSSVNFSKRPGIALKIPLLELVFSVAARERKCSSRVIIGLVVEDIFCVESLFGRSVMRRGDMRADLINERVGNSFVGGI